jgi:transcriptional regulator with XRE-family HTH domain
MSQSYISRLLRGERRATVETLDRLAKALGVTLDEMHAHLKRVTKPEAPYGWKTVKNSAEVA